MSARQAAEWRRTAFLSVAVALLLFLYLFSPFSALFLGWFVDFEDNISHRVHEVSFGLLFAMMLAGVAVQLRRPEANVAGLQQAILVATILSAVVAVTTGWEWTALLYVLPPLGLAGLHPARRQVFSVPGPPRGGLLYLTLPALLPLMFGFLEEFDKAVNEVRGHQAHWGGMATFALVVPVLGVLAACRPRGWRPVAWTTGLSTIVYGVASLSFPFDASARPDFRAVAAIGWGLSFLVTTERIIQRDGRGAASVPGVGLRAVAGDQRPVLRRVRRGRIIGGVAAGVARHYGLPVAAVRALLLLPVVGQLAYLVGWAAIPVEKPGEVVGPPPDHRPKRLVRVMVVTPAIVFAMLLGLTLYEGLAGFVAPPVPHDITSTAARSCLECHATGTDRAPVIDPLTHQFYDDEREHRSSLPFCGECHRLPEPGPTAGLQWDGVGPRQGDEGRLGAADLDLVWHMLGRIDSQPAAP